MAEEAGIHYFKTQGKLYRMILYTSLLNILSLTSLPGITSFQEKLEKHSKKQKRGKSLLYWRKTKFILSFFMFKF